MVVTDASVLVNFLRIDRMDLIAGHSQEDCVAETQTGFQRRRPEHRIVQPADLGLRGATRARRLNPPEASDRVAADLFGERFLIGVAPDSDSLRRRVAVVVKDGALRRPQDEKLIGSQIQLDARDTTRARSDRPPVAELALAGHRAARVFEYLEFLTLFGDLNAGPLVDPFSDFAEDAGQEATIDVRGIGKREVDVFGEAVGFEIAFLRQVPPLNIQLSARAAGW